MSAVGQPSRRGALRTLRRRDLDPVSSLRRVRSLYAGPRPSRSPFLRGTLPDARVATEVAIVSVEIVLRLNGTDVPVVLDDSALAAIAAHLPGREESSPWLNGAKAAAEYLGCPLGRVEKLAAANAIPCHRIGRRLVFDARELDRWLREGGG